MLTPTTEIAVGEQEFRDTLRHFASGVTVITALDAEGTVRGMTATAFASLSLRPPLVLVAVARGARCHKLIKARGRFGVSILREDQVELSRHYGGQPSRAFKPKFKMLGELPVLDDVVANLACTLESLMEGGDHSIVVGLVTAVSAGMGRPLIHYGGRYHKLSKP